LRQQKNMAAGLRVSLAHRGRAGTNDRILKQE